MSAHAEIDVVESQTGPYNPGRKVAWVSKNKFNVIRHILFG